MKTNRRPITTKMIFFIGLFWILSVSSCVNPHHRQDKTYGLPEKFEPVPVERENGFYATTRFTSSSDYADIELEIEPAITLKEIKEIRKTTRYFGTWPEVELRLTEEGSHKLYLLTKANIGKPIAVVIENQIVALPMVMTGVVDGRVSIAGGYSDDEIDSIIEVLKKGQ
jgi:preprotein translocase subunit SecD